MPVSSCEGLKSFWPNTTNESAIIDTNNDMYLVAAIVTHPPAGDRVKVWVGLPLTNWNGRFLGTGGGGFLGGSPGSLHDPVARIRSRREGNGGSPKSERDVAGYMVCPPTVGPGERIRSVTNKEAQPGFDRCPAWGGW
jgi:hypothetical protein